MTLPERMSMLDVAVKQTADLLDTYNRQIYEEASNARYDNVVEIARFCEILNRLKIALDYGTLNAAFKIASELSSEDSKKLPSIVWILFKDTAK